MNAVVILDFGFLPPSYALYSIMPFSSNFRNCFVTLCNLRKIISLFCEDGTDRFDSLTLEDGTDRLELVTLEDGTDRLSRNVGTVLLNAA